MKSSIILSLLFFCSSFFLSAQNAKQWFFGSYAGLSFYSDPPSLLNTGQMTAVEGCAVICDVDGQILIYTNGVKAFTRNHTEMPNGTDLAGNLSSVQSSVIVPKPGSYNPLKRHFDYYYIFTSDGIGSDTASALKGVRYSLVDMSLNNGNGDIVATQKNIHLFGHGTSETLAAGLHSNGCNYWVVSHEVESSNFRSYLVNENGVDMNAVISDIGPVFGIGIGSIKISPNNKLLAITKLQPGEHVQLYKFDNTMGRVTNHLFTDTARLSSFSYSCEFSADSKVLYSGWASSSIVQYNLDESAPPYYNASRYEVNPQQSYSLGMQRGPDGKIYIVNAGMSSISVINNPNALGAACNYTGNRIPVSGTNVNGLTMSTAVGLPNLSPQQYSNPLKIIADSTRSCTSLRYCFSIEDQGINYEDLSWEIYKDNVPSGSNTLSSFCTDFTQPGNYVIRLKASTPCHTDSVSYSFSITNIGATPSISGNLSACETTTLTVPGNYTDYNWYNGSSASSITLTGNTTGVYAIVKDGNGCTFYTDTVDILIYHTDTTEHFPVICKNDSLLIHGVYYSTAGTYSGHFQNSQGCDSISIVHLSLLPRPVALFSATPKEGTAPLTVLFTNGSSNAGSYWWDFGNGSYSSDSQSATSLYSLPGTYEVVLTADNGLCTSLFKDTIIVKGEKGSISVPNVFTPNDDGNNDIFTLQLSYVQTLSFKIYNRWGNFITELDEQKPQWDGKSGSIPVIDGTYFYTYEATDIFSETLRGQGFFMLIR